jgi:hypothetical protein
VYTRRTGDESIMASKDLREIIKEVDQLSIEEQMLLITHIAETARRNYPESRSGRAWSEIRGAAPYPLLGEDAQEWVSRTRREADEQRDRQLNRTA